MPSPSTSNRLTSATDQFIGENLPRWLKNAASADINALRDRFKAHLLSQQAMRAALKRIPDLRTFAETRLSSALQQQLSLQLPFEGNLWRDMRLRFEVPFGGGLPSGGLYAREQPLLQRLLQNFRKDASFFEGSGVVAGRDDKLIYDQSEKITRLVRDLDIGQAYQQCLAQVLDEPFATALATDKRAALGVAAELALMKGQIGLQDAQVLRTVVDGGQAIHASGDQVRVCSLSLLGCHLDDVLVFELRGNGQTPDTGLNGLLLYLGNEPEHALRRFAGWQALGASLGLDIRQALARRALVERIALQDRPGFLVTLGKRLSDPLTDVEARGATLSGEPFSVLAQLHLKRIKDDARLLAVPTAQVDENASEARIKSFESVGLALVNLAGLFVPGVGMALLGVWLAQTLAEVFEGAVDWSQGHRHEALEHMLGVAENVAVTAALATGVGVAARGFARSSFVDGLVPVRGGAVSARLWAEDLAPYRVQEPPAEATQGDEGLRVLGARRWWQHAGHWYELHRAATGEWRLLHARRAGAYGPALVFNGEQAWRLQFERPLEWQGAGCLLTRLWPAAGQWQATRVAQVLKVADVDEALLRGLLVENRPLPPELRDTLERVAQEARIEAFLAALAGEGVAGVDRELLDRCLEVLSLAGPDSSTTRAMVLEQAWQWRGNMLGELSTRYLAPEPLLGLLQRDFPGLPRADAQALLLHADQRLRLRLQQEARVPLALAEQARGALQQARLRRMLEGLYLDSSANDLSVELLFALLNKHVTWPRAINVEFRDGSASGRMIARLRPQSDDATLYVLVRRQARFTLHDSRGLALDEVQVQAPEGLFEAVHALVPEADRQALRWSGESGVASMRRDIQEWAPSARAELMRLVGMRSLRPGFIPIQRLADGRLGYPLSGRGAARLPAEQTLRNRVRALYQGFSDNQVDDFVATLQRNSASPFAALLRQEQQFQQLDSALEEWTLVAEEPGRSEARRLLANRLRRCWRLQGDVRIDVRGGHHGMILSLVGIPVGELPELPEGTDFGHVTEVSLVSMGLQRVPLSFLQRFHEARWVNLSNNQLREVPTSLAYLASLRELRLRGNRVRLNAAGVNLLADQRHLRVLDLSDNPLGAVSLYFRRLNPLRELYLRNCNLPGMPVGLEWCNMLQFADLRGNQILTLPEALMQAPWSYRQRFLLRGNPLPRVAFESLARPEPFVVRPTPLVRGVQPWLEGLDDDQVQECARQWQQVQAEEGSGDFFAIIDEMTGGSDFRTNRAALRQRVWRVIAAVRQDSQLRGEVFELAGSPRSCVDSVATVFSNLQVRVFMADALRERPAAEVEAVRLGLARQLFRLDQVEQFARQDMQARRANDRDVDEIEVSLAYRVGLARELNLPGQPSSMQFATVAQVTRDDLDAAVAAVRRAEASDELARFISQRDFWVDYIRQANREAFETAGQPFWDRLEALEAQREALGDGPYLQQVNQIRDEREAALDALTLSLTRQALVDHPA